MTAENAVDWSTVLMEDTTLRVVEPHIYSVLPDNETGSEYDTKFGTLYDRVACSTIYNRLVWGYSVEIFSKIAQGALRSTQQGNVLDLGCGSLAFTAETYSRFTERPVVLVDQSLQMLRIAKSRLEKTNGAIPGNMVFLHADALALPFRPQSFTTILSENLLHCLPDTNFLLNQLKIFLSIKARMFFTTLVKGNRVADGYLEALAKRGKLIVRTMGDHQKVFDKIGMSVTYDIRGNLASIYCSS